MACSSLTQIKEIVDALSAVDPWLFAMFWKVVLCDAGRSKTEDMEIRCGVAECDLQECQVWMSRLALVAI